MISKCTENLAFIFLKQGKVLRRDGDSHPDAKPCIYIIVWKITSYDNLFKQ